MKKKLNKDEIAKSYLQILKEQEDAEKQIISNYDYISWLENFTQIHEGFADDSWLYKKEELSAEDYAKVEALHLFFNAISDYCRRFHINIEGQEKFEFEKIHIKHNNVGYQLGLVIGQGSYVYVCPEIPQENAICFDNIMNNIAPEEFKTKKELLQKFEKIISTMKEADIPSEIVINTLKKYYKH
ncbi:MAG: hypothetical protein E7314_07190 [Clostridiales bacterium]|nr:hypothetical protein [Clostridiales bacterium]